jgi:hypothetical protein
MKRIDRVFTPARHDPFPQVPFITISRREGTPSETSSELALLEMLHEIADRNCGLDRLPVLVDFDLEGCDSTPCSRLV